MTFLCIDAPQVTKRLIPVDQILQGGEALALPERLVPGEDHQSDLVNPAILQGSQSGPNQPGADAPTPKRRMDGGMVDVSPAAIMAERITPTIFSPS